MALVWQARHGIRGRDEFQAVFDSLSNQGLRMIDVSGFGLGGVDHYACTWEQSGGPPWAGRHFLDRNEHQQHFNELTGQGFRPIRVSGYDAGGVARYASIWEQRGGPALEAFHHIDAAAMQGAFDRLQPQGFRPIDVSGYVVGGQVLFTAIWEQSPMHEWMIRHNITHGQFLSTHEHNTAHGFVPRRISGYEVEGTRLYTAIWEKATPSKDPFVTWSAEFELAADNYQNRFDAMARRGFQLIKVDGIPRTSGGLQYATIWHKPHLSADDDAFIDTTVRGFMATHNVPGASVALAHQGRLVFARGYGTANPSTGEQVTTGSRFRSASVAKPITAVAIFRLIEAGQLNLGDRVFGAGHLLGTTFGTQPYGNNVDRITVQHLLEHTSGWPQSSDPMFGHPTLDHGGVIGHMLDNVPLSTVPGAMHDYCNFNYCVLGRIIERVSGLPYAEYVRQNVFVPCGINSMQIAGDTLADRQTNEVVYTGQGSNPYGMRVGRMDAHGGWIGTAIDLVRFLVRVDGFPTKGDILNAGSITTMSTATTAPAAPSSGPGYAKGWATNATGERWHLGDLPGTMAIIVRTHHGFCWAVLANSRNDPQLNNMRTDIDGLMWTVIRRITDWPAFDLF